VFFRIFMVMAFLGSHAVVHGQTINDRNDSQVSFAAIKALAILQTLNANLLASKSATQTLQAWCEDHEMAAVPKMIALRDPKAFKEASEEVRALLKVSDAEPVLYRRVQLVCGEHVLSQADNWYVPSRLTDDMNLVLMQTNTPFGRAVRQLNFHRQTERSALLWNPLPKNWEQKKLSPNQEFVDLKIPKLVLQHQAILITDKNIPFSVVIETYTKEIFAFRMSEG
jgi:chorismate-pyruvate lyase